MCQLAWNVQVSINRSVHEEGGAGKEKRKGGKERKRKEKEKREKGKKRKEKKKKERKGKEVSTFFLSLLASRRLELVGPRSLVRRFYKGILFKR